MTLSPPIRVFAVVGVLIAAGLAAFFFLLPDAPRASTLANPSTTPTRTTAEPTTPATRPSQAGGPAAGGEPDAGSHPQRVPGAGRPRASAEHGRRGRRLHARRERRRRRARARRAPPRSARGPAYVALSALSERLVRPLVAKTGVLPDPAVLVAQAAGRGHLEARRDRSRHRRSGRRPGAAMSERSRCRASLGRELYVRHARLDGRSVAVLRAVDRGDSLHRRGRGVAEGRSHPGSGAAWPVLVPSPVEATRFVTHAVEALIALGCDVRAS